MLDLGFVGRFLDLHPIDRVSILRRSGVMNDDEVMPQSASGWLRLLQDAEELGKADVIEAEVERIHK